MSKSKQTYSRKNCKNKRRKTMRGGDEPAEQVVPVKPADQVVPVVPVKPSDPAVPAVPAVPAKFFILENAPDATIAIAIPVIIRAAPPPT